MVGGDSEREGRVEVCFSQRWGTVNGDGWSSVDTKVACRQLGYETNGEYFSHNYYNSCMQPLNLITTIIKYIMNNNEHINLDSSMQIYHSRYLHTGMSFLLR